MGLGMGGLQTNQRREPSGSPFTTASAVNGTSIDTSGRIVLGNVVGNALTPAILLNNREIVSGGFTVHITDSATVPLNTLTLGNGRITNTAVNFNTAVRFTNTVNTLPLNSECCLNCQYNTTITPAFTTDAGFRNCVLSRNRAITTSLAVNTIQTLFDFCHTDYFGSIQFENDIAAAVNTINITGDFCSAYMARIEMGSVAANQNKNITGTINGYSTQIDINSVTGNLDRIVDFYAGGVKLGVAVFTVTTRIGLRIIDMSISGRITNRYGILQEGVTDLNSLLGFTGFGVNPPTARVHIGPGTATAGTAPAKLTTGVNLAVIELGSIEYNGVNLFFTRTAAARENVLVGNDGAAAPGTTVGVVITNFYGTSATNYLGDPNSWASVNINGIAYKIPLYT